MCIICIEFNRQRLNLLEARRAIGELKRDAKTDAERSHYESLENADDDRFGEIAAENDPKN